MIRLLSIELQKIWQNRASKVITIIYFLTLGILFLLGSVEFEFGPFKFHAGKSGIFNFPYIWHFCTYIASWLKLFFAIIVVSMVANEYSYGTFKQNLIDGMSKKEFILSKFLTIVLFSLISTILVFIVSLILGLNFSSYNEVSIIFSELNYFVAYFLELVGFFSFCFFVAILIKRSAFALGFLFIWMLFEFFSFGIIKYVIFNYTRKDITIIDKIYDFFPLQSMTNLIEEPFTRLNFVKSISATVGEDISKTYEVSFVNLIIVVCWILIFMFLSYKIIKKRDL